MAECGKDRLTYPNQIIDYSSVLELQNTKNAKFPVGVVRISTY